MVTQVIKTVSFYWERLKDPLTEEADPMAIANETATKIMGRHLMIAFTLAASFKLAERCVVSPVFENLFTSCFEAALTSGITGLAIKAFYDRYPQNPMQNTFQLGNSDFMGYGVDTLFCATAITVNALACRRMQNHPTTLFSKFLKATQPTLSTYLIVALKNNPIVPFLTLIPIQMGKAIFFWDDKLGHVICKILPYATPLIMCYHECFFLFRGCRLDPAPYVISAIAALAYKQLKTHPMLCEKIARMFMPISSVFLTTVTLLFLRGVYYNRAFTRMSQDQLDRKA
jgi:hypothetical protein